jgi:hypothetical protein
MHTLASLPLDACNSMVQLTKAITFEILDEHSWSSYALRLVTIGKAMMNIVHCCAFFGHASSTLLLATLMLFVWHRYVGTRCLHSFLCLPQGKTLAKLHASRGLHSRHWHLVWDIPGDPIFCHVLSPGVTALVGWLVLAFKIALFSV